LRRHSLTSKLAYASGTVSFAVKDIAFGSFVLFYYVSVIGLSGKLAGLALLIAMIWDAVTDPIVGSISDNLRSKWGRRHPLMAISGIPLGISLFALFNAPDGLSQGGLFAWMLIICLLVRTFLTLFTIPYLALGAELSEDYQERSSITGLRTIFGWFAAIGLAAIAWQFIFTSDGITDGRLIKNNYYVYGIISFAIIAIFTTLSIITTAKHIPDLPNGSDIPAKFSLLKILQDVLHALQNRNFRNLFYVMLTVGAAVGVMVALTTHMATYFWELTTSQIAAQTLFTFIPIFFMLGVMKWLNERLEKHTILKICTFLWAANTLWLVSLRLLDLLPENGNPWIFRLILVQAFISTVSTIWFQTISSSVIADIGDEQEFLTHERQEGMFFAAQGFSIKFVTGIGSFAGGIILDVVRLPIGAAPGTVDPDIVFNLGLVMGPILTIFFVIPFLFARKISLTKARHDEVRQALLARHAATQSASAE
jgi:Na+/melibiose symporter-like transporter